MGDLFESSQALSPSITKSSSGPETENSLAQDINSNVTFSQSKYLEEPKDVENSRTTSLAAHC